MHRPTSRDSEVYLSPSIDHAEAIINSFASRSQAGSISTVSTAADPKIKLLDLTQQKRPPAQIYQESTIWGSPALRTIDCEKLAVKPGGWVEFQDWDGYPYSEDGSFNGTDLQRYNNEVYGAFEMAGYEIRPGVKLEKWFKDPSS
ncbi:hypothetical protein VTN49DRAFT_3199 [Thermomyces lanuginosus]|uniref:uncharacterized protein n=1 Tax=Thermomyces lanuginosus TaxID=5541 RepID=UPI003743B0D6